jgi:tryptophanase
MLRIPEPWRIKVVEPIRLLSRAEREDRLATASFSMFRIRSEDVFIDLFTDSGTSAMSDSQWAGLMLGDEAYAGARNYYHFETTIREVFGLPHVLPVHQGRVAENMLCSSLVKPGTVVPSNTHFDTMRAHVEANGGVAVDLLIREGTDPVSAYPFKGNIDIERLERLLVDSPPGRIPFATLTLTNNMGGGQPVSLANVRAASALCKKHAVPLYIDACRFAENAWFIKQREQGQGERSVADIVQEVFSLADGATMSAKKDGLANMGGFVASRDRNLIESMIGRLILYEGFPTYGGLTGRDLEAVARGLREVLDEEYLRFRTEQVASLGDRLLRMGVPILRPTGGHAVYVDGRAFLPAIPRSQFPAQALCVALYREGGIRTSELGAVMHAKSDPNTGEIIYPELDLLRLAIPRRVYTDMHLAYVADIFQTLCENKKLVRGLRMTYEAPVLRHFTARFEELPGPT